MNAPPPSGDNTLGPDLLAVTARLNRWATSKAQLDVSPAQARMLAHLEQVGPLRTSDLAKLDHSSQPTMTAQVQRAETDGWVSRFADPDDRRASLIDLTEAGRAVLYAARRARGEVLAPHLARLNKQDRQMLRHCIEVIEQLIPPP